MTATVILHDGSNFYVGKYTDEDTITAAFHACVSAADNLVNNTRNGIVKISGEARIETTIDILTKIFETTEEPIPICALSSGKLVYWWNSEPGYKFQEFNKKLIQQGINIQRVFILDKSSIEIEEIMERQKRDGIDVRYILEENVKNFPSLASTNLLVCGDKLTTTMVVNSQENEEDGSISFVEDDIRLNQQRFDEIWNNAAQLKSYTLPL